MIKKADRKRIQAFKMWVCQCLLRVSWTEHHTNRLVLEELEINNDNRLLLNHICLKYFRHTARRNGKTCTGTMEKRIYKVEQLAQNREA